ncbi:MAG: HEAT repeat domain-containing protein, partial [Planctomycetota bacterium]
ARPAPLALLEDLMREDEKVGGLSGPEVRDLVQAATHAVAFGGVEERAVRLAMLQKTSAKVRKDLVESLAARSEPAAAVVLADLLVSGGLPAVREAIADARPAMRVAAARAARRLIEEAGAANAAALKRTADALRPGLEVIARDDVPDVAIRAAVALHALGEPKALDRLEAIYKAGNTGVKVAVAAALGDVKADDAYPLLNLMLANERGRESGVLRAAALQALGRTKHVNAVNLLIFYLLNDADPGVQHAAANALIDLGSDGSRLAVIRALTEGHPDPARRASLVAILGHFPGGAVRDVLQSYLEDKDAPVARAAALALAAQNVAASVPYLIEMARSGNAAEGEDAIRALENVSLVRFRSRGHKVIAEEYEAWYRTARITAAREPDRAWLRDALHKQGYDVGPLTLYVAGQPDPTSVPLLIRALRDEDPLIRRGAAIALGRITGLSFGEVGRATSLRDASRVADAWSRWWSRVKGPPDR